ncbi:hypothetical protein CcCBS67573_g05443 [Chytriomyces confervae]|uniref:RBR-type E3 ubiquitin transferase n=1 Tax=Chytriomyces confervae TaxID=246404 RepID=A0A507FCI8_9FUNG|nr:hypothetical protein CcCBS67573_g05443 [Chytriomyces confervae]
MEHSPSEKTLMDMDDESGWEAESDFEYDPESDLGSEDQDVEDEDEDEEGDAFTMDEAADESSDDLPLAEDPHSDSQRIVAQYISPQVQHLTLAQINQREALLVAQVSSLVGRGSNDCAILLRHFAYDKERLVERYFEDPESVLFQAGICPMSSSRGPSSTEISIHPASAGAAAPECSICYSDIIDSFHLACAHSFCRDCYHAYCTLKIRELGQSSISCLQSGCSVLLSESLIKSVTDIATFSRYDKLLSLSYVDRIPTIKWCPAPDCENAVECSTVNPTKKLDILVPAVSCQCGTSFCFGCAQPDHRPIPCGLVQLWHKKCSDDSETINWLCINTVIVTTAVVINFQIHLNKTATRNLVQRIWTSYSHKCDKFEDPTETDRKSAAQLHAKYVHYSSRFINHEQSGNLDQTASERTRSEILEVLDQTGLSWVQLDFITQATQTLVIARSTLKWTYAFAYFLCKKQNSTHLFEDNQADLEGAVEALSGLLQKTGFDENPQSVDGFRKDVLHQLVYVRKRADVLMQATAQDLVSGQFVWNADDSSLDKLK